MEKIVIFDTETNGFPLWDAAASHPAQARIAQIAALTVIDGQLVAKFCRNIRPDGWTMPDEVAHIHGLTQAILEESGVAIAEAISEFDHACDGATLLVAHNMQFDKKMLAIEYVRIGRPSPCETTATFCTMKESTYACNLPGRNGKPKWPKLIEAHQHYYGCGFEGAHGALDDAFACARVFFAIQGRPVAYVSPGFAGV